METQSIALRGSGIEVEHSGHGAHHGRRKGLAVFGAHFVEMSVAMMVGMMIGMGLFRFALGRQALSVPEIGAVTMAIAMAVPMAAWMLVRGHSWRVSAEMAAAMVAPVAVLLPFFWLGSISGGTLKSVGDALMMPAMIAAMLYRRHEYGL